MVQRRFTPLPVFRWRRVAPEVRHTSPDGIAAASWADAFRVEHADLVGEPPADRPRRHRWLVAASILGLVVMAAVLHADLRRAAAGSKRGLDVDQRRTAIAEAVAQELVRTREAFEAYQGRATHDLAAIRDSLTAREKALHQAEQERQAADDLATERGRTVEIMAAELASARREAATAQAAIVEARMVARDAVQAAQAAVRTETKAIAVAPPPPAPVAAAPKSSEPIPAKAEARAEPSGLSARAEAAPQAGEGPRFGRSDMAWLPLAETAFMSLDTGHAGTDAAPVTAESRGKACLDGLPALSRITSPPVNGKGAKRTKADAGPPRAQQRASVKAQTARTRGSGAQQRPAPDVGADLLTGERPAVLPGRS